MADKFTSIDIPEPKTNQKSSTLTEYLLKSIFIQHKKILIDLNRNQLTTDLGLHSQAR